jgi:phenylpropionate dioxygenase-like ring-hydroxylating dioxygenase large terminal subunit
MNSPNEPSPTVKRVLVPPAARQKCPRNQWYVAAGAAELGTGLCPRMLLGRPVVMYRKADGTPVALADRCPHRGFPLSGGVLKNDVIRCGYHGMSFDASGACVNVPTQDSVPRQMRVTSYPIVEKLMWLWIWMGDPAKMDPTLIPDLGYENGNYHNSFHKCYPIPGNFQLLHENVLDATHASYLHTGVIDNADMSEVTATAPELEIRGNFIRTSRTFKNFVPSPLVARAYSLQEGVPVDRYLATESHLPSFCMIVNRFTDPVNPQTIISEQLGHIPITPASDTTSYHFLGFSTTYPSGGPEDVEFFRGVIEKDALAVAASQSYFDESDADFKEVSVKADEAALRGRRIIAEMAASEEY